MITTPSRLGGILLVASLGACAFVPSSPTTRVDLGNGAWSMTKKSGVLAVGSGVLKPRVEQEALAFCADQGRALAVLDSGGIDPEPPAVPSATVTFRCVAR